MAGIVVFGFGPLLYAAVYYFRDTWQYLNDGDTDEILIWQVNRQRHVRFVNTQSLLVLAFMNCEICGLLGNYTASCGK
jgi:hypothetical protein